MNELAGMIVGFILFVIVGQLICGLFSLLLPDIEEDSDET